MSEEQLDALSGDYRRSDLFDERERLAIEWAEKVTENTARYDEALFGRLRNRFSDQEIVELTMASALFNMTNRINDSLRVDLENQDEVDKIKRSVRVDARALHDYVERANATPPVGS